jgi:dynein regulatory complex protein 1
LCISEEKLAELLDILIEEADFIFDDKMREELEKACLEEKLKEKMELLKKTLSIDSVPEFNLLIE